MVRFTHKLLAIGVGLTILGCFLTWYGEGDFVYYRYPGIEVEVSRSVSIDPLKRLLPFDVTDNGGVLIALVACGVLWLAFRPPPFIREPLRWLHILSIAQTILAVYHLARLSALGVSSK